MNGTPQRLRSCAQELFSHTCVVAEAYSTSSRGRFLVVCQILFVACASLIWSHFHHNTNKVTTATTTQSALGSGTSSMAVWLLAHCLQVVGPSCPMTSQLLPPHPPNPISRRSSLCSQTSSSSGPTITLSTGHSRGPRSDTKTATLTSVHHSEREGAVPIAQARRVPMQSHC